MKWRIACTVLPLGLACLFGGLLYSEYDSLGPFHALLFGWGLLLLVLYLMLGSSLLERSGRWKLVIHPLASVALLLCVVLVSGSILWVI